jgi:hypothetical protein
MQKQGTVFYTAGGRSTLSIADVNEAKRTIRMRRSTGKITWDLDYDKLYDIYQKVEARQLSLDQYEIDSIMPTWGNYIVGLLRHLGCQ